MRRILTTEGLRSAPSPNPSYRRWISQRNTLVRWQKHSWEMQTELTTRGSSLSHPFVPSFQPNNQSQLEFCRAGGNSFGLSSPTLDYSNETIEGGVTCFQSFGSTSTRNPLPPKIEPQLVFWAWFLVLSWLDTWLRIAAAAPRKVEQLDLQLHLDWKPVVACSAVASLFLLLQHDFSGSQIKRQFYICYTLSIPNPTLKVLHLVHAFHLRVSACPVLEDISFKYLFLR